LIRRNPILPSPCRLPLDPSTITVFNEVPVRYFPSQDPVKTSDKAVGSFSPQDFPPFSADHLCEVRLPKGHNVVSAILPPSFNQILSAPEIQTLTPYVVLVFSWPRAPL